MEHMATLTVNDTMDASGGVTLANPGQELRSKIEQCKATIGVVGLGYVGLPLAVEFAHKGFVTRGIDLDKERVHQLNAGHNYNQDLPDEQVEHVVNSGYLLADDNFSYAPNIDVFFICVPTPVTIHKDPDTRYIESATKAIASHIRPGQLIVLKSTTYPNTTEGVMLPILEAAAAEKQLEIGRDVFLAFSPERIDPGNKQFNTTNTPIVVGGVTPTCTKLTAALLRHVVDHVHEVSSPKVAEMEKLLENTFRSVNIALVNELARLCDRMGGISMWEVVEAAATKPFGFMPFYPGPGLGGHCIPIDPYYLSWLARSYDFETGFITLASKVNEDMPYYVAEAVVRAIARQPVRLQDANVLVLGVAFKRDVDDTRHSPAIKVIELLQEKGLNEVNFSDPHVEHITVPEGRDGDTLRALSLNENALKQHHVAVILTDHTNFPYELIAKHAACIVDTRNALKDVPHENDNVILLGGGGS